jgi:hypothetical protein
MKRFMNKKLLVVGVAVALVLGIGGAAFAYFLVGGSGTGTAPVATAQNVTITQIGAGYDSLAPTYHQDQCLECAGPLTEFGNEINLASGSGQLSDVVVAFRSYGTADASFPITLTLYTPNGSGGVILPAIPYADITTDANVPSGSPRSVFYATFDFSHIDLTLSGPVVYGITYTDSGGVVINTALSNSVSNLTVGTDEYPGYVFVDGATNALSASGDAGSCATSTAGVFMATDINCATPPANYGAYGPGSNPANADIPAVEFNVVGGVTAPLWPGQTENLGFAITNSNPGSVYLTTVTIAPKTSGGYVADQYSNPFTGCYASWFTVNPSPVTLNQNVPVGTTFFQNVSSISMSNPNTDQSACEGAHIGLTFTSP